MNIRKYKNHLTRLIFILLRFFVHLQRLKCSLILYILQRITILRCKMIPMLLLLASMEPRVIIEIKHVD